MAPEKSTAVRFDPIEESRKQWLAHGWDEAADGMNTVISVMRVHQLFLAMVDAALKPFSLTFSRYEVLTLLSFTKSGTLPMSKISARLQVHATSTTNSVDRLEKAGLVRRRSHPDDRRTTLVDLTEAGRELAARATSALNDEVFTSPAVSGGVGGELLPHLEALRVRLEDSA